MPHAHDAPPTPGRGARGIALGGAAVAVAVIAVVALQRQQSEPTVPAGGASESEPPAVTPARRATSQVRPERPVSATLPSGTRVPIRAVSTGADGVLAVPHDIRTAGWWRGGARVGDPFGSILVAAHVDSATQGLGPYVELLSVRPGQRVVLRTATLRQDFTVQSLRLVPQGLLRRGSPVYAADGPRRLTLVTCAPPYVKSRGGYQNLAVVVAVPTARPVVEVR